MSTTVLSGKGTVSSITGFAIIFAVVFGGVIGGVLIGKSPSKKPIEGVPVAAATKAPATAVATTAAPQPAAAPATVAQTPQPQPQPEPEPEPQLQLNVRRVASVPSQPDPFDLVWHDTNSIIVPVEAQMITNPMLDYPTITEVRVRAVTDGNRIAWLLSWESDKPATATDTGRFSDGVAVQFPLAEHASYMMGGPGSPVQMLHWRAQWQKDVDEGFQDVYALYPNFWSCGYWFADNDNVPQRVPASFSDPRSHQWFIARQAGNPMADFDRVDPVDELIAEGFGSLTHVSDGTSTGRGVWRDGRWHVALVRPILDDELSKQFRPGASSEFGVAVWDGEAGNVGGRKHYSFWVPFEVAR